ncbi:MAG: hypothetical protein ACTSUE_04630 [Promethearchaeota archaeon]
MSESQTNDKKLKYPLIKQTLNTCGLASLAMIFLFHSDEIKEFLLKLYRVKYLDKKLRKKEIEKPNEAIIWSLGYLLLKAKVSRKFGNWISRLTNEYEYMDYEMNINIFLEKEISDRLKVKLPDLETLRKYFRKGIIRKRFLKHYLDQFKTQIELRMLATMLGFSFEPYPGDVMGNLYFEKDDDMKEDKIIYIQERLDDHDVSTLLGHGQSHWMVPHTLKKITMKSGKKDKKNKDAVAEKTIHALELNDPMGGKPQLQVSRLDHTYIFYFFKYKEEQVKESLEFLKDLLHL